ncbi:MAG: LysR substrate-binding domain-containing protein, partial [Hyphomicrobiales bacterium]
GRPENSPRKSLLKVNNVYGLRRAVQTGIGIASIPDYIVGRETNLVMVPLDVEPPSFDTYLVFAEELRDSKRVSVFREFVIAKARKWSY